ncbi:MAG: LamG domain-containing protein [Phycisphaerae bacterium]|nr:LamG domain-containing protein [Phycisphaerae bacterium]
MRFDGIDDYVDVPNTADWNFPLGFTLKACVRIYPGDSNSDGWMVSKHRSGQNAGYGLFARDNHLGLLVGGSDPGNSIQTPGIYNDGQWHRVVGVYSLNANTGTGLMSLYVDGELKAQRVALSACAPNNVNLRIGRYTEGYASLTFDGDIDEVQVISGVLTLSLDIIPQDCPNLLTVNLLSKGRLPVAILGSATFDVSTVDVNSISIGGVVYPVKAPSILDVSAPAGPEQCACQIGTDGYSDLVLHFSRRDLIQALGLDTIASGAAVPIAVEGQLLDGMPFEATDCVPLVGRE